MIGIKEMEMPKCCHWDCPLCNGDGGACMLGAYDNKTDTKKERAKDCPLVEIVTCKDCKYYRNSLEHCTLWCSHTNDNFYCADAERRE